MRRPYNVPRRGPALRTPACRTEVMPGRSRLKGKPWRGESIEPTGGTIPSGNRVHAAAQQHPPRCTTRPYTRRSATDRVARSPTRFGLRAGRRTCHGRTRLQRDHPWASAGTRLPADAAVVARGRPYRGDRHPSRTPPPGYSSEALRSGWRDRAWSAARRGVREPLGMRGSRCLHQVRVGRSALLRAHAGGCACPRPAGSGGLEHAAKFGDETAYITFGDGCGDVAGHRGRGRVRLRSGAAAGAAEAVGECFRAAGDTALGALHHHAGGMSSRGGGGGSGGQTRRHLVAEPAADEAQR